MTTTSEEYELGYRDGESAGTQNAIEDVERLRAALERIAEEQQKALAVVQQNGFVFDDIGRERGNWQHLAFTLYTDLCEIDAIARAALDDVAAA